MTIRSFAIAMAVGFAVLSPAAQAQKAESLEQRSLPITEDAFAAIRAGKPQRALDLVEPVIADFEKAHAGQRRIYCAETVKESSFYMLTPGSDGGASTEPAPDGAKPMIGTQIIVNSVWCKAMYIRAFALVDLDRFDDAQAVFERLIQFAPRRSRYLSELGFVFQHKRQWQNSLDYYTRSEAAADLLEPADRDYERCVALRGMGFAQIEMGQLDAAEATFKKCLAITPNEPKSLNELEYIKQQRRKVA